MKRNAAYYIEQLDMTGHPEGGYFKESFMSDSRLPEKTLGEEPNGERSLWTSIYFLLENGEKSHFHRLKSDEMWYFHDGSPLSIYMINPEGQLIVQKLGLNLEKGETPQMLVPKGYIFGSAMNEEGFSLVGCMVSPGFVFEDFELFERQELLDLYPEHETLIRELTRAKENSTMG